MLTPLILFLGLTVATAVIAYWSDNLGKKLGKKRVTLFGLRPRTTATLLTVTSSWAIMLFTLASLLAVATPLRNALFLYDRERAQFDEDIALAETQLSQTQKSLSMANKNLFKLQTDLEKAGFDTEAARQAEKTATLGAKNAKTGEKQAQNRAKTAQDRAKTAQTRAVTAQQREASARRGEQAAERQRNQANRELNQASISLVGVRNKFNSTQDRLEKTQAQLEDVEAGLREAEASYARAQKSAFGRGREVLALGSQIFALSRQRADLRRQRADLEKEVKGLAEAARLYSVAAVQLAGGDVRIAVGRTFAARIIAARESSANVEAQLRQILAQGQAAFEQTPETGPLYQQGARLILFPLPEKGVDNTPVLRALAQNIASNGAATSVRLVAAFNSTAQEKQIAVRFITVPVDVAFREGEILASATIEGAGDASLFRELNNLIEDGREEAVKRKVNPPLWLAEPNFYAPGTDVGLFEALRRIQASERAQRVRLVAAQDLSTVEPLRVRFEVEDAPTS